MCLQERIQKNRGITIVTIVSYCYHSDLTIMLIAQAYNLQKQVSSRIVWIVNYSRFIKIKPSVQIPLQGTFVSKRVSVNVCFAYLTYSCYMSMALMTALLMRLRCFLNLFRGRWGSRVCVCGVATRTGVVVLLSKTRIKTERSFNAWIN